MSGLKRYSAELMLRNTNEQLRNKLSGTFTLVFYDGEINTNSSETLYSSIAWDIHRKYPKCKLSVHHHIKSIIGDEPLTKDTHSQLFTNIARSMFEAYGNDEYVNKRLISEEIYNSVNQLYNDLSLYLEEYPTSMDIVDIIEVIDHPNVASTLKKPVPSQEYIDDIYKKLKYTLVKEPTLAHNPLCRAARTGVIKTDQIIQALGPRGYVTDIDSNIFDQPILNGYAYGLRKLGDHMKESRAAAKSLLFNKTPLQETEYSNRRVQLLSTILENLHPGDCGSKNYLIWTMKDKMFDVHGKLIRRSDVDQFEGKYYLDEESGQHKMIKNTDTHLLGKTLKIRSIVAGCNHLDTHGVCATCFGGLSVAIPEMSNIGYVSAALTYQQSSQSVLSVKHLDGSSNVEVISLGRAYTPYMTVNDKGDAYLLNKRLKGKDVRLVLLKDDVVNLPEIDLVKDVSVLSVRRITEIDDVYICVYENGTMDDIVIPVVLNKRRASLTYEMLEYIKKKRWTLDDKGNYVIDMSDWDYDDELMSLPMRHFNMSDHAKAITNLIEGSSVAKKGKFSQNAPEHIFAELYELINNRLNVNAAHIEVIVLSAMVTDLENNNYNLPKGFTTKAMGKSIDTMKYRSLSSLMACRGQAKAFMTPSSFFPDSKPSHLMDVFLRPREVINDYYGNEG